MPGKKKKAVSLKSVKMLEKMLDCVGSPVFAKDRKHRFVYLNKAAEGFLGFPNEKMLGRDDSEFFPPEQVRIFWERDDRVFRTGEEDVNEENLRDAEGRQHTIVTRKRVFRDAAGNGILVGVISDITGLRKAHGELDMFRKLLENSNDAIFIADPETGRLLDVNETACRRLGYPRAVLLRMTVPDVDGTAATWEDAKKRIMSADNMLVQGRHVRADGSSFPVEISVSRVTVGGKEYLLGSARDITERRKMEEAMKEVDTLRGLIPICAKCKNIRDDKGFWHRVEAYLEQHSSARFTHGLCKKCMKELYGKESWFRDDQEKS